MTTAQRVARRFLARARHFRINRRRLKSLNDRETNEQQMRELGGYSKWEIKLLPIRDIAVEKVWKPGRFKKALEKMEAGVALDPINAVKKGSKWLIEDGIHRTNASIAMGYTHVPAFVSTWIETPDKLVQEPPEKKQLRLGDWVKMNERYEGKLYGFVDEILPSRKFRGVKRHWYNIALVEKGDDWPTQADFSDTEFEPTRMPSWGQAVLDALPPGFGHA